MKTIKTTYKILGVPVFTRVIVTVDDKPDYEQIKQQLSAELLEAIKAAM